MAREREDALHHREVVRGEVLEAHVDRRAPIASATSRANETFPGVLIFRVEGGIVLEPVEAHQQVRELLRAAGMEKRFGRISRKLTCAGVVDEWLVAHAGGTPPVERLRPGRRCARPSAHRADSRTHARSRSHRR